MDSGDDDSGNYDGRRYVSILEGESARFLCDYCNRAFLGNYSAVEAHLLRSCEGMTPTIRTQVWDEFFASKYGHERTIPSSVPRSHSAVGSFSVAVPDTGKAMVQSKKRKKNTDVLEEEGYLMKIQEHLDAIIARIFYSSGLSFNVARNPEYRSSYSLATRKKDIFDFTDAEIRGHLDAKIAMMFYTSGWHLKHDNTLFIFYGLSFTMEFVPAGLPFQIARNPFLRSSFYIASLVHIPGYVPPGPKQLKTTLLQQERTRMEGILEIIKSTWGKAGVTIVADGWSDVERKQTKEYITDKFVSAIENVGPENVVQVITDNDPVCRAAGALIQEKYSHIKWTPIIAHTLSLALNNICSAKSSENIVLIDCHCIAEVAEATTFIKNFIINHTMKWSIFDEFSQLKMLDIPDSCFASDIVMLKRFRLIKQSLLRMIVSDQWPAYRKENIEDSQIARRKLIDDLWWDRIDYILAFTEPIYSMIHMVDTEKSCFRLIYEMWDNMVEKVKAAIYKHEEKTPEQESTFYSVVHGILADWWNKSKTPLHCLAHMLNPRHYSVNWIDEGVNRVPPHHDSEMSDVRNSCLRQLFPTTDDLRTIKQQYAEFALLGTKYFSLASMVDRDILDPKTWWVTHGASASKLQSLALKLLS
ncbi:hypothetical protein U9M48_043978 [Paspalum notatum var. saurae]|uniref:DUF659 domain-containing protein n=1 Tax=Paspalum notatum var. saurae TaxID=547442 RepID=A0AAQ3UTX3_PASNO